MDQAGLPGFIAFVLESGTMSSLIQWVDHPLTFLSDMVELINQQSNVGCVQHQYGLESLNSQMSMLAAW